MKFMLGFFVGLVVGALALVTGIAGFIGGIVLANQDDDDPEPTVPTEKDNIEPLPTYQRPSG